MKHWMLLLFTGMALHTSAQTIVSGTITDNVKHKPLEGVSVSLQSRQVNGVYTDAAGHYKLSVPKGAYTLKATYLGYTTYTQNLTVQSNISIDITLEQKGLFVNPVEITSLRAGKNAPFTTSEISADDIKKQNLGQDLPMLLSQETSVVTNSDAGNGVGYTGIRIRGSDITRINVTLNGIPVNDAEAQGAYFVDIPDLASSTNSIQIQRGVGTSTNGAGAFGATLNISTNELRDKAYAETDNSYGSFNTWKHTVKAGSGLINGHFTVDARLSMISSDGYIDRATSNLKSFYTSAAYVSKKTAIRFNILSGNEKTYQAWYGVPQDSLATHRTLNLEGTEKPGTPYSNQTDNYQQDYYQLFLNQEINEHWNFNIAAFLTRGRGYYEEYKAGQAYGDYGITSPVYGNTTVDTTDLVRQLWLDNYFYGGIFSLNNTGSWLNSSLGGGFSKYDGKHFGLVNWAQNGGVDDAHTYYTNYAHKTDFNIYWKGDARIAGRLHGFVDLQYRYVKYDILGFDDRPDLVQHTNYNFFNPKVGLTYNINDNSHVFASFAISNHEPNRDDYENNKTSIAKPEKLRDVEAGYVLRGQRASIQGNLFYMDYKDQLVQTGKLNDVGAYTRVNVDQSYRAGVELQVNVQLGNIFSLAGNAAFSRNKIKNFNDFVDNFDDGGQTEESYHKTDIAFSPWLVAGYTLTAKPLQHLSIDLLGKYVSQQYLDNSSRKTTRLSDYYVSSLRFNYAVPQKLFKELGLQLMLNNIFNRLYEPAGSTYAYISGGQVLADNYYSPMAGFNIMGGVHLAF